ncbi:MAG: hypothetical protein AAF609_17520 [Cyanobacteria bacterium P01_C01_bin.120]
MPLETVSDSDLAYYLINFDSEGSERVERDSSWTSDTLVKVLSEQEITDVFVFSHGWMGDIPAAKRQYEKWVRAMAANTVDIERLKQNRPGFKPLLVGVHWPSLPWGDETLDGKSESEVADAIVSTYSKKIADTESARAALQTIVSEANEDIEPDQLSDKTITAYNILNQESGLGSNGEAAAPGDDREPFDPEKIYRDAEEEEDSEAFGDFAPGDFLLNRIFSPLRSLSYWKMKERARQFGESGGFNLLCKLQHAASDAVRFHLIGHSFGCIVMTATLAGPNRQGVLPRPVNSLCLIQGALSLWAYCQDIPVKQGSAGYFYPVIAEQKVVGPIVTTQSEHDSAVGKLYPLASGIAMSNPDFAPDNLPRYGAIGAFGIQGRGLEISDIDMRPVEEAYIFEAGKIYNLEASRYISKIPPDAGLGGAHSAIDEPEVAHAVWSAAMPA